MSETLEDFTRELYERITALEKKVDWLMDGEPRFRWAQAYQPVPGKLKESPCAGDEDSGVPVGRLLEALGRRGYVKVSNHNDGWKVYWQHKENPHMTFWRKDRLLPLAVTRLAVDVRPHTGDLILWE